MKRSHIVLITLLFPSFVAAKTLLTCIITASLALSIAPLSRTALNFVLTANDKNAQNVREYMQENPVIIDLLTKYTQRSEEASVTRTQQYGHWRDLLKSEAERAALRKQTKPAEPTALTETQPAATEKATPQDNVEHEHAKHENPYSGQ